METMLTTLALILTCSTYPAITEPLRSQFNEAPSHRGLNNNGHIIELWQTSSGSTWTLVLITPSGRACVMNAGEAITALPAGSSL